MQQPQQSPPNQILHRPAHPADSLLSSVNTKPQTKGIRQFTLFNNHKGTLCLGAPLFGFVFFSIASSRFVHQLYQWWLQPAPFER
jgi:hypothetical protein